MERYYCDLCGFLYDEEVRGPMPDDYASPLCGADRSHLQAESQTHDHPQSGWSCFFVS